MTRFRIRPEHVWRSSAALAVLVGVLVLLGWLSDIKWIGELFGTVRLKANTAACFVLIGVALLSLAPERIGRRQRLIGLGCAGMAALVGLATLGEWVFGWDLHIDQLLFTEEAGTTGTSEPGRMAATTATCFFLAGTAISLLRVREIRYAQGLSLGMGLLAILAFSTFLFDAQSLSGSGRQTQMAAPTFITFLALSVGILSARSGGLMRDLVSKGVGGVAARFLIPAAVAVPTIVGWLALRGQTVGLYSAARTHALLATANIAILTAIALLTAHLLNKVGAEADRQRAYFAAIVESASDAILTCHPDGNITTWNDSAEKMFGYTAAEVVGRHEVFLVPEELRDEVNASSEEITGSTPEAAVETIRIAKDGTPIPVSISRFRIRGPAGAVVGTGVLIRDITERVRVEEAQKMEAVGQLAAGIAHDFNNKLAVILGYADMALAEEDLSASTRSEIAEIRTAALRSAELTRQLLAFARMEPTRLQRLDLNAAITSMLNMLGQLIGDDASLIWQPDPRPCWVRMDPGQVDQILVNLVVNARDAISGNGTVTITTMNTKIARSLQRSDADISAGPFVVMEVTDDGCGMDPATMARAFVPFFTTKPPGKGTGLGLATVYGIAHQNRGFVELASELGTGSTVSVYLPRGPE